MPMLLEAARRIGLFLTTCLLTLGAPTAHQAAFASGDVNRVMTAVLGSEAQGRKDTI
jgi:hypothetical protein